MKNNSKAFLVKLFTGLFLLYSCFYMYDFYKCLSGFIANGFREATVMLPMILAFFLPVFCFLFFFYDTFVGKIKPPIKAGYAVFVILYAVADLALIFSNISLYASNNSFGVYDALPSVILHFPYDMIVLLSVLCAVEIFNLICLFKRGRRAEAIIEEIRMRGTVKVGVIEYIVLSVFAVVIFVFAGASVYAVFSALSNALYDVRYVFLLLWVMLIPMGDLILVTLKPEKADISKKRKLAILGCGIFANIIFGILFLICELTLPDFMVHIGKPLFLITFSISLPIEACILFGIMALGALILAVRFILEVRKKTV